jgi:gliding motility-associated-like protein
MIKKITFLFLLIIVFTDARAQICGPNVPTFTVNLTGNPGGTWLSPSVIRNDNCCGTSSPDRCVEFIITLDPSAQGIAFSIAAGAIPGGALFYQINCGPPSPVGSAICLSGPGPHYLTFCKPGNNNNVYQITSIPGPTGGTNVTVNDGCVDTLHASGFNTSTITWNSIYPGTPGQYNGYLSCNAGCANPIVAGSGSAPPYVDYVVCGQPAAQCNTQTVCDTVRVTFNPTLHVSIVPTNPTICFGQTSTTLTATGSGGTPPYHYLWNNVNPSQTISVGVGTYNVQLSDASGCPPVYASVTVTAFSVAITANAGPDQTKCSQSPLTTLNATVTGASGGIWSGGAGTFSPNNTTLSNVTYSPTPAEVSAGQATLVLTTTGNGTCPPASDTVKINFAPFTGTVTPSINNVNCYGSANGSSTVTVNGGHSPYTYTWTTVPTQTTSTATGLGPGTYTVNISDGIGCVLQTTVAITQPTPLVLNGTVTNASCAGGSTGSISATASGGTGPYTYTWSPGNQNTSGISNQPTGTYTVTAQDSKGCITTASYTITQPTPLSATVTPANVSCNGGSSGSASVSASGGTPSYTYSWSPTGGTSSSASGLPAGTYTVLVTDNKACTITQTVSITQPTALTATLSTTNETCDYLNNGTASVTAGGGTPAYTYSWQPGGQITSSISGQQAGTYTVTVKDNKGCSVILFATITQPPTLTVSTINPVNVSCPGGSNGSVTANPSGGTPGYTYSWTPGGQSGATATNLPAGIYTLTVADANGCAAQTSVTITQPPVLTVTPSITNVSCAGGANGSITATPAGGTPGYTYVWQPGNQTTATASGLSSGVYTVTVTDSKGCTVTASYTVTQPAPLSVTITPAAVSCNGGSNGTASASVSGGTPVYSYSWSPSGGTSSTASGLSSGTYTVLITDSKGCLITQTVSITQPTPLTATTSATNETCDYLNNGSASVSASGGTPAYSYTWQPGNLNTSTINNQASGTYTATISDSKGCLLSVTATINQPAPIVITFTNQINVSCFGGNNGSIAATVSGGTPNYSYSWMPGSLSGANINNLPAGTYTLTVTDANSCTHQGTVAITQPAAPVSVSASSVPATCNGGSNGSVSANASGGTSPYSYSWLPGNLSGQNVNNLPAGTYTVTATDSKGCTKTNTVTVTQPPSLTITTSSINSTCGNSNGEGTASVSGGLGPYTYTWMPGSVTSATLTGVPSGSYTVNVTDANGCPASQILNVNDNTGPTATIFGVTNVSCYGGSNGTATVSVVGGAGTISYTWSPMGGNGPVATGLPAGTYIVYVSDTNGCRALATTSPGIQQPPPITIAVATNNVSCFGGINGSATASASGGTPGFSYVWLPGNINGPSVTGLSAGIYTVQVTDANSCVQTQTFVITQPSAALAVSPSSTPVSCFGGSNGTASSSASGGTSPYNYSWSPGNLSGQNISNLPSGTYTINVTDNNGCAASNTVSITQPSSMTLAIGSINSTCGFTNGQATVTASGATPGYTYSWSPSGGTASTASNLNAGVYYAQVTDAHGCVSTSSVTVSNTPGPTVTVSAVTNVSCSGGSNGTATSIVSGGTGAMNYTWSPTGGNSSIGTGLSAGTYTVFIKDANGCPSSATATIGQPQPISISVTTASTSCFGGSNGSASALAGGGTPGFTFVWLPGGTIGPTVNGLPAGTYTVQATDANSCVQTQTFTIGQPASLTASISATGNVSCFGGNNGSASVNAGGGTPFYNYSWIPSGGNGPTAAGLSAGSYTVNITDVNGCTTSASTVITQPAQALSATSSANGASCFGGSNGTATITPSGGTPGYNYQWNPFGGTGQSASGLTPGNYVVVVSDAHGCVTNVPVTISQGTPITGSLLVHDASCGFNNGAIVSQISGGTAPYTYSWSPGSLSGANISNVGPGTYTLLVTDALNCTQTFTTSLNNIAGPNVTLASTTSVSCFGGNNGSATINISQGTSPYTISWMPYGGNSTTASSLIAGTYTATVTDGLGCVATATATIIQPTPVNLSIASVTNVSCFSGNNGAATVQASGGTPAYTYAWNPSVSITGSASNLPAGIYTVTATDQNGCPVSITVGVSQPALLSSTITAVSNAVCYGGSGNASVNVSGGTAPYSYTWTTSPVQNGSTASNLPAGSYTVDVTDAHGCTVQNIATITQPQQVITAAGVNDTVCIGHVGTISASASGGSGNYYYAWQPSGMITSGTLTVTANSSTSYTVVAYDQNGCAGNPDTVSVIAYTLGPGNVSVHGISPICPGHSSTIYVQTTGVTGPLTYSWSNNLGNGPGAYVVTPNQPTTYVVTVSNACGSSVTDSIRINFNPPPTVVLLTDTNSLCVPGNIQFTDQSITGNVNDPITTWYWTFGDGTSSSQQNPSHAYTSPGTYTVILSVGTAGGCANSNSSSPYIINAYPYPLAAFSINSTTLNIPYDSLYCLNQSVGASSYSWSFGDGGYSTSVNPQYLYNSVGHYQIQLIASSAHGCMDTAYAEVTTTTNVVFPNAFTPNPDGSNGGSYTFGDLTNDVFFPYTSGVTDFKMQIFNRWGELIFETLDIKQGWDGYYHGKLCQQDVYVWKAFIKFNTGKTFNKTGDVTLLR